MEGSAHLVAKNIDYKVSRGEKWERLIVIKDERTHRKRPVTQCAASVLIDGTKYVIPTEITSEGAVLLEMTAANTEWLTNGTYTWDLVVTVSSSALLTSTPLVQTVAAFGNLVVSTYDNITPMDSDGVTSALEVVA